MNTQMRCIQKVKFPVSVLMADAETGGNPFEVFDILTGGVVSEVYPAKRTDKGTITIGAQIVDPTNGRTFFLLGMGDRVREIHNLKRGDVVHAIGEYRYFNNSNQLRLVEFLDEAPIVTNGRFAGTKTEPVELNEFDYAAPGPVDNERVA